MGMIKFTSDEDQILWGFKIAVKATWPNHRINVRLLRDAPNYAHNLILSFKASDGNSVDVTVVLTDLDFLTAHPSLMAFDDELKAKMMLLLP